MANISCNLFAISATITLLLLFFISAHAEIYSGTTSAPIGAATSELRLVTSGDMAKHMYLRRLVEADHKRTCLRLVVNALLNNGRISYFELAVWPGCCEAFENIMDKYPGDQCRETLVGRPLGEADALILFMYCSHDKQ